MSNVDKWMFPINQTNQTWVQFNKIYFSLVSWTVEYYVKNEKRYNVMSKSDILMNDI